MTIASELEPLDQRGSAAQVLLVFLKLGLTSFGGPIAHIGYFRDEFVVRRRWIDELAFADLVALCQFLPGPASSQVGFAIGLRRAGFAGALAAWTGFTLPSGLVLIGFAYGAEAISGPTGAAVLHGLKLVAVAIVAQAVLGMARSFCPDRERASIALAATLIVLLVPLSIAQVAAILVGGLAGLFIGGDMAQTQSGHVAAPITRGVGLLAIGAYFLILAGGYFVDGVSQGPHVFNAMYRSGALVFGGGHVVLPLLREAVVTPGWISDDSFLAGYGTAQAVPGPLFTFAAYLGAAVNIKPNGIAGALVALAGIFLPGMLILTGTLPFWAAFRKRGSAQAAMRGVNAAVVGILVAALYNPVWTTSVKSAGDFAIALAGFVLLTAWRAPPIVVVALSAVSAIILTLQ